MESNRVLLAFLLLTPANAWAQFAPTTTVTSSVSPLRRIFLGAEGSLQVDHRLDSDFQIFPPDTAPADYGTIVAIGSALYTPAFDQHPPSGTATGFTDARWFTPLGQTGVLGQGTLVDPFRVTSSYAAGSTGIEIVETTTYVEGQEWFLTDLAITNTGTVGRNIVLYRAADCYLGGSDDGYGAHDPLTGAIACTQSPNNDPVGRIEEWLPISRDSQYFENEYDVVWAAVDSRLPFPNTCACDESIDNGAGLSWSFTLPAGAAETRSHITTFSPLGHLPVTTLKLADDNTVAAGSTSGYLLRFENPNSFNVDLVGIFDELPAGFSYVPNSTQGPLTSEPTVVGSRLVWTATVTVPGGSNAEIHFDVRVATATGTYFNNAGAIAAGGIPVSPSGESAPIVVTVSEPSDGGLTDGGLTDGGVSDGGLGDGAASTDAMSPQDGAAPFDASQDGGAHAHDAAGSVSDGGQAGSGDAGAVASDASGQATDAIPDDEGCGCRTASGAPEGHSLIALGFLACMTIRRRRRPRA